MVRLLQREGIALSEGERGKEEVGREEEKVLSKNLEKQ